MKKNVIILGSTGSIGLNTIEVLSIHSGSYNIFALVANSSVNTLFEQCKKYNPKYAYMNKAGCGEELIALIKNSNISTEVLFNEQELMQLVAHDDVDIIVCAISGSAGLKSSVQAARSGKKVLLANKESLVMCGSLFMEIAKDNSSTILPVDSEHNALHQCFAANSTKSLEKIILTASGGPFLDSDINKFDHITPKQALKHPTWDMGKKISIDSATMMNKGLEVIEAMHLFNLRLEEVDVIIHPQSLIHSMVCYNDGSIILQASKNDMKIPIAYCLGWPYRIRSGIELMNLTQQPPLTFQEISKEKFPCFYLAKEVAFEGDSLPAAMNAANEIAVHAFLDGHIKFTDIYKVVREITEAHKKIKLSSVEEVIEIDSDSRVSASKVVKKYKS
jgi:1-deoxy-D-xylulose-5-phosphate reductoisomerase